MGKDKAATRVTFGTAALWFLLGLAVLVLLGVFWPVLTPYGERVWAFLRPGIVGGVISGIAGAVNALANPSQEKVEPLPPESLWDRDLDGIQL